ncbi:hypothetical protein DYQ86_18310 [Acidobacteria bacterium AB60]|nr:hypothetical protein DYQ86_18310 [Acidobacteria bacterium AB60]
MNKRPYEVTVVSWILIVVGVASIAMNASALLPPQAFQAGNLAILGVRLLGILCAIYMLRRRNWARWTALAWIAFHAVIGFLNSVGQGIIHALIFGLIGLALLRSDVGAWFRGRPADAV